MVTLWPPWPSPGDPRSRPGRCLVQVGAGGGRDRSDYPAGRTGALSTTTFQLYASAQAPWTSTIVGRVGCPPERTLDPLVETRVSPPGAATPDPGDPVDRRPGHAHRHVRHLAWGVQGPADAGARAEDRGEFHRARDRRPRVDPPAHRSAFGRPAVRRHRVPPRDRRLHDPGR